MLLNELAAASAPHVLVLDNFHMINSSQLHEEVEYFVSYLPPTLRLLVASRQDPPLPLARLRVKDDCTEVRAEDLRFDQAESTAMLSALAGPDLAESDMVAARRRTEGWAAGLQLAGLALRSRPDGTRNAELVENDERNMIDYFAAEVMPELTAEQYDLLVRAAPLNHYLGPLCDAALGMTDSAAVWISLMAARLFVVALDRRREWYRCHHLFREALLREAALGAGREAASASVLRRAAGWFVDQDLLDDAAHYLLRAGDGAAAARLLESSKSPWFFERGLAATYLAFGDALPSSRTIHTSASSGHGVRRRGLRPTRRDPALARQLRSPDHFQHVGQGLVKCPSQRDDDARTDWDVRGRNRPIGRADATGCRSGARGRRP